MYIVLTIILINAAGLLLKFNNLDRFIIFFGFRFHLSLVLPCFLLIIRKQFTFIKLELKNFNFKNFIIHIILVFIPLIILIAVFFILKYTKTGDPDYFYEFGLSSIVDLPVYFIWNLPQLLMITLFIKYVIMERKLKFILGTAIIISIFMFELIPLQKEKFLLTPLFELIFASVLFSLIAVKAKDIYTLAVSIFIFLWSNVLFFGSENKVLINNLLAKNYLLWNGFLESSKLVINFNFIIQTLLTIIIFLIYYIVIQRKTEININ